MKSELLEAYDYINRYLVWGKKITIKDNDQTYNDQTYLESEVKGEVKQCSNCGCLMETFQTDCPRCKAHYLSFMPWELGTKKT